MPIPLLFDLDGTVLNTLPDLTGAVNYTMALYSCPMRTEEDVMHFIGNGTRRLLERCMPEGVDIEAAMRDYKAYYKDHCMEKTRPYPGIYEILKSFKGKGYILGVVSNKPESMTVAMINHYFPGIFPAAVGDLAPFAPKPSLDNPRRLAEEMGIDLKDAVFIGDGETDMETAKNASARAIGVTWGYRPREILLNAGAEALADNAEELLKLFSIPI